MSQVLDLFKSRSSTGSGSQFDPAALTATPPSATDSTSGASFSSDVNKLLLDLQSSQSATATDSSSQTAVAGDVKQLFGDVGKGGHHHHHAHAASAASGPADRAQTVAASLLAYTKSQGLGGAAAG